MREENRTRQRQHRAAQPFSTQPEVSDTPSDYHSLRFSLALNASVQSTEPVSMCLISFVPHLSRVIIPAFLKQMKSISEHCLSYNNALADRLSAFLCIRIPVPSTLRTRTEIGLGCPALRVAITSRLNATGIRLGHWCSA